MRIIACRTDEPVDHLVETDALVNGDIAILPKGPFTGGPIQDPQPSDGPLARALGALAARRHCAIVASYQELEADNHYLSVLFVDSIGRCRCSYRKTHLNRAELDAGFAEGRWLTIVPFRQDRIGLLLGDDLVHPEPARCLRLEGATLLIACGTFDLTLLRSIVRVRAAENRIPVVVVAAGTPGRAIAADGQGQIMTDVETPAAFALPPVSTTSEPHQIGRRRPDLYRAIVG